MKSETVKPDTEPSWEKFAWAVFLFHIWNGNDAYMQLMGKDEFVKEMWRQPFNAECAYKWVDEMIKYLNKYGCRLPFKKQQRYQKLRDQICQKFQQTERSLQALHGYEIETVCFDKYVELEASRRAVEEIIEELYNSYDGIEGFGPTPTAKLLHILQPQLFVMWDNEILKEYHKICSQISHSGHGYCFFLQKMQSYAQLVNQKFSRLISNINQTSADYLSEKLKIKPSKTFAKYLDEYNWVTITRDVVVPPSWHPDKE